MEEVIPKKSNFISLLHTCNLRFQRICSCAVYTSPRFFCMGKRRWRRKVTEEKRNPEFLQIYHFATEVPSKKLSREHPGRRIGWRIFPGVLIGRKSASITCRMRAFKSLTWLNHWNLGPYIPCCACWKWQWQFQKHLHLVHLEVQCVESGVLGIIQNILKKVASVMQQKLCWSYQYNIVHQRQQ